MNYDSMPRFRRVQFFHLHSVLQVTPLQGMESIQHAGTPPQEPVASQSQVFVLMGYLLCLMLLLSLMKKLAGLTAKFKGQWPFHFLQQIKTVIAIKIMIQPQNKVISSREQPTAEVIEMWLQMHVFFYTMVSSNF